MGGAIRVHSKVLLLVGMSAYRRVRAGCADSLVAAPLL